MSEDDFQLNTLHLLDALIVTLNFRPKIECPPELQGRLKQLQIAIGRHFCAADGKTRNERRCATIAPDREEHR